MQKCNFVAFYGKARLILQFLTYLFLGEGETFCKTVKSVLGTLSETRATERTMLTVTLREKIL